MGTKYKRIDSTKRSMLISSKNMFEIIGRELGKEKEMAEYRRLFDGTAASAEMLQDYPVHIDFELNFICNYRCPFCVMSLPEPERNQWGDPNQTLSFEAYKKIIDEGVEKGLRSVQFNGNNEPLTVQDLPEFISYARNKGIVDIIFNTNGSLLDTTKAHQLIDSGVTRLMISLDAFKKETYERYRVRGNYEKVKENVLNFLRIRNEKGSVLPLVRLSFLVHTHNIDELSDFITFWKDKVDFFALQSLRDVFTFDKKRSKELRQLFEVDEEKIDDFFTCPQPFLRAMVRHNGDVLPCCSSHGMKLVIGNIHESSLYEIWNGDRAAMIRDRVNDPENQPEACQKCRQGSTKNFNLEEYSRLLEQ